MNCSVLRIVDANLNRASEGLRVLEDIARFSACDEAAAMELRAMRHDLAEIARPLDIELLTARDSLADVGRESGVRVQGERTLLSSVRANAKRAAESLRVLEELARVPDTGTSITSSSAERLRYSVYDLEKRLAGRITRTHRVDTIRGLYVVVDRQAAGSRSLEDLASEAIDGGAAVIQLRDKVGGCGDVYREAVKLNSLCCEKNVLFVVNDYADVAAVVGAGGLHIGQRDLPLAAVRKLLPIDTVVGVSCKSRDEARRAIDEGADYIAVGSMFPTSYKAGHVLVGLELLGSVRKEAGATPLVAIGGIDLENVASVVQAGADAIAVISAVVMQHDVRGAAAEMVTAIRRAQEVRQQHE